MAKYNQLIPMPFKGLNAEAKAEDHSKADQYFRIVLCGLWVGGLCVI